MVSVIPVSSKVLLMHFNPLFECRGNAFGNKYICKIGYCELTVHSEIRYSQKNSFVTHAVVNKLHSEKENRNLCIPV